MCHLRIRSFALGTSRATGNTSGTVQLSSTGTFRSNLKDNTLRCTAIVNGPDGSEVARTSLLRTRDYKYVGIWNANVAPGVYKLSINASANGLTKIFADILEIEVTG